MSEPNAITSMSYAERLNTIHRLRLLRNTTGELSAHTGIQLRNNSFSKKAPFIARCIYSEFCREVQEQTDIDLDELLASYYEASRYFEKIAKTRKAQPEFHREMLRCLLDERFAASDEAKPYLSSAKAAAGLDEALLTLLVLEILPRFQAKQGDVDPNTHLEHLVRLREYFRPLYDGSQVLPFAPYLTDRYQNAVRQIRSGELFTRLDMIHFAQEILANLKNNHDPEALLQTNCHINRQKIHPDLMHGVWKEGDQYGGTPIYWLFEELGMDYVLIHRKFDKSARCITEWCYEVCFYQKDEMVTFQLLRQSEVEKVCTGTPIIEQAYMNGCCAIDDLQTPQRIEWNFTTNRYDDLPSVLIRAEEDIYDKLIESAMIDEWKIVCETGDYTYLPAERVITQYAIYIECESIEQSFGREVHSWYRIPRTGLLKEFAIETPIAHIRHEGRVYICFIPMNRSFDVTDDEARAASEIEIVERIEVITPMAED